MGYRFREAEESCLCILQSFLGAQAAGPEVGALPRRGLGLLSTLTCQPRLWAELPPGPSALKRWDSVDEPGSFVL